MHWFTAYSVLFYLSEDDAFEGGQTRFFRETYEELAARAVLSRRG